jgi:hypothetical protein
LDREKRHRLAHPNRSRWAHRGPVKSFCVTVPLLIANRHAAFPAISGRRRLTLTAGGPGERAFGGTDGRWTSDTPQHSGRTRRRGHHRSGRPNQGVGHNVDSDHRAGLARSRSPTCGSTTTPPCATTGSESVGSSAGSAPSLAHPELTQRTLCRPVKSADRGADARLAHRTLTGTNSTSTIALRERSTARFTAARST